MECEEGEDWSSKLEGYSPHQMKEEGKRQEEELEWDLESMELKRPYPGIKLLYWEYGTPGNIWEKQEPQEDQESRPPR